MDINTQEFITEHIKLIRFNVESIVECGFFDESTIEEFRFEFAEWMVDFIADMVHDGDCSIADAIGISPAGIAAFFEDWATGLLLERQDNIAYQRQA